MIGDTIMKSGEEGVEACPRCGSEEIMGELRCRDGDLLELPREAYGEWNVCEACGHEWPEPLSREEAASAT